MSREAGDNSQRDHGFPRVSGDEPRRSDLRRHILPFSPRERG